MQRTITQFGVDFEVEFDRQGNVDAIYIGGTEVSDIISDVTRESIETTVIRNVHRWFDEYHAEMAAEERAARECEPC